MTSPFARSRVETLLNGVWEFKCDADPDWGNLRVPGCYAIPHEGKWRKNYWDAHGYPAHWEDQGAWYRRTLALTAEQLSRPLAFRCEGCYHVYRVFLNGKEVGSSRDGYTPLTCPLNEAAVEGTNVLEIRVEADPGELSGGEAQLCRGIWQDTWLISHAEQHVVGTPILDTRVATGTFSCRLQIRNQAETSCDCQVTAVITDRDGTVVQELLQDAVHLEAQSHTSLEVSTDWADAHLWFPHDPYLYTLTLQISNVQGEILDHWQDRFGFREVSWQGHHLYLNGKELYLRGHGGHYLGDLQGTKDYHLTWFRELKQRGVNFLRLHVYPKHRDLYRAADEVGIMLMGEPAFHFLVPEKTDADKEFAKDHLGRMIDHLRIHPSIIMWSVSNELRWRGGGEKPWLVEYGRSQDPTRPVFSSDFSAFSTHGDLIGHHYNTDTVFEEWEEHGPDKPMIWDECGEVWQPKRPLHNGSAGYETACQDYATGTYRDGCTEIQYAMDLIREGRTFAGQHHRVNAVVPWDLGYVFFRWQPMNRFRGICMASTNPESAGLQPTQILPFSSPLNIWDPTLPVYEPNPGFYLFEEDIKSVRFPRETRSLTFFPGTEVTLHSPLFFYEDLREADRVRCRIEDTDGHLLSEHVMAFDVKPGEMRRNLDWNFGIHETDHPRTVFLVRQFEHAGTPGHRDVRTAYLFPRLTAEDLSSSEEVTIHDPEGNLIPVLRNAGIACTTLESLTEATLEMGVLVTTATDIPDSVETLVKQGLRVLHLTSGSLPPSQTTSAVKLVNSPQHRVLDGIPQQALTFWRGGCVHQGLERPVGAENHRMLLAADRNGTTSALHERYLGKGRWMETSIRIVQSLDAEPAAHALLRNLLRHALRDVPGNEVASTAVFGSDTWWAWMQKTGVVATRLDSLTPRSVEGKTVLLIEGQAANGNEEVLKSFTQQGGTIWVQELTSDGLTACSKASGSPLTLTEPFLGERHHCVKASRSWTLRNTPDDGVEYYHQVVIPQPYEPNLHPLLSGVANADLKTEKGTPMFSQGIKPESFDPVGWNDGVSMLVSNWRIDWSLPPAGGEYISVGKDIRRAQWFLNRDPVLLEVKQGSGRFVFCQMRLAQQGETGLRVMRQFLTNMGCSLGIPTHLPPDESLFQSAYQQEQDLRLRKTAETLATLPPLPCLPDIFQELEGRDGGGRQPNVLLILDHHMQNIGTPVSEEIGDSAKTSVASASYRSVTELETCLHQELGSTHWDIIYFTLGEDTAPEPNDLAALSRVVELLKETNAQLMWGSTPPLPSAWADPGHNQRVASMNASMREYLSGRDVYINDCAEFYNANFQSYLNSDAQELREEEASALAVAIAEAIQFFGN